MLVPAAVQADVGASRSVIVSPADGQVHVAPNDATGGAGLEDDTPVTVRVLRDGVQIGFFEGTPSTFRVPGSLEINHAAAPTACWEDVTPAILPGDVVEVSSSEGGVAFTDTVDVPGFQITEEPVLVGNALQVKGTVETPRPPIAELDVAVRLRNRPLVNVDYLASEPPHSIAYDTADPSNGAWTALFELDADERDVVTSGAAEVTGIFAQAANEFIWALPATEPLPPECPGFAFHSVTSINPSPVNLANQAQPLVIGGATSSDATAVEVTLTDADSSVDMPAVIGGSGTSWSATFQPGDLTGIEGLVTASAVHTLPGGPIGGTSMDFVRDLTAPGVPGFSPAAGTHNNSVAVTLNAPEPGASMFYTTDGTAPSPSSTPYSGPITLTDTTTLRAIAVDTAGNPGAASAPQVFTIAKPPGKPTAMTTHGDRSATIQWTDGATNNAAITGYRVTASAAGEPTRTADLLAGTTSHTFEGLTNGTAYTLAVRATNAAGDGAFSNDAVVTPRTMASRPRNVQGSPGIRSARVTWRAPRNDGGATITGYKVITYAGGAFQKSNSFAASRTAGTIGGLSNGTDYEFAVVAVNSEGDSAEAVSDTVTPQQRPNRVRIQPGTSGRPGGATTATARWLAPAANTARIVRYEVRAWKLRNGRPPVLRGEAFAGANRRARTMFLPRGSYKFQVRAIGETGNGRWSKRSGRVTAR